MAREKDGYRDALERIRSKSGGSTIYDLDEEEVTP